MGQDHCLLYAKLLQGGQQQRGLGFWRPCRAMRAVTVTKAGAIKGDHPVMQCQLVDDAGVAEVVGDHAVTMQQDNHLP